MFACRSQCSLAIAAWSGRRTAVHRACHRREAAPRRYQDSEIDTDGGQPLDDEAGWAALADQLMAQSSHNVIPLDRGGSFSIEPGREHHALVGDHVPTRWAIDAERLSRHCKRSNVCSAYLLECSDRGRVDL